MAGEERGAIAGRVWYPEGIVSGPFTSPGTHEQPKNTSPVRDSNSAARDAGLFPPGPLFLRRSIGLVLDSNPYDGGKILPPQALKLIKEYRERAYVSDSG